MDILSALQAAPTAATDGERCCVGRWLDGIPDATPGKDDLAATFAQRDKQQPDHRRLTDLSLLARTLGFKVSTKSIQLHRACDCACYGRSA